MLCFISTAEGFGLEKTGAGLCLAFVFGVNVRFRVCRVSNPGALNSPK